MYVRKEQAPLHPRNSSLISLLLHTHTHTQHVVGPQFHLSQYQTTEGETQVVRLSAPILTRPQVPHFTGSIEVDITAEDLPSSDPRQKALFGKCYPSVVHLLQLCVSSQLLFILYCNFAHYNRQNCNTENKICT